MGNELSLRKTLETYLARLKGPEFSVVSEAWSRADTALREATVNLEQAQRRRDCGKHQLMALAEAVALAEEDLVATEEMLRAIGEEIKDTESALAALAALVPVHGRGRPNQPCTPVCG